jgi:putative ABC transport system permease protein
MDSLAFDLRLAARSLRKAGSATVIAVICLALGLGANTAIYSVVRAVLLAALPYSDAEQLVQVGETWQGRGPLYVSPANYFDLRTQGRILADLAAWRPTSRDLALGAEPERLGGIVTTVNLFDVLGARPVAGRAFAASDTAAGAAPVVVISEGLWRRRFAGSRAVIGSPIALGGVPHIIIGVMAAGFDFPLTPTRNDIWLPLDLRGMGNLTNRSNHTIQVVGRLIAGVDSAKAMSGLVPLSRALAEQFPKAQRERGFVTVSMRGSIVGDVRVALLVLLGAVGVVLLIACANVANLLLARAAGRRREVAIRAALGATRRRLVRQFMTESVLLAAASGIAGLVIARLGLTALVLLAGRTLPRAETVGLDAHVLLYAMAISLATGLGFGIIPARRATRSDLREDLAESAGRSSGGRRQHRMLNALIVGEIALSLVLLTGAGLIVRSFLNLLGTETGFEPARVLTFRVAAPAGAVADRLHYRQFHGVVLDRLRALPGVRAAGFTNLLPIQDGTTDSFIQIIGHPVETAEGRRPDAQIRYVSSDYFKSLRIPVLSGRELTDRDTDEAPPVMVVNDELVRRFMSGEEPIGKQIDPGNGIPATIVGVVRSVRQVGLDRPAEPELYLSAAQQRRSPGPMTFVVSTAGDPLALAAAARRIVHDVAPSQPVFRLGTMDGVIAESLKTRRLVLVLLAGFAGLALVLAAAGVYGVMSYAVSQRTREMGIRMALGARGSDVAALILGDAGRVMLAGVVLGLLAAAALTRVVRSIVFGVGIYDPLTFAAVPAFTAAVALLAGVIPAIRASRIDPLVTMRSAD